MPAPSRALRLVLALHLALAPAPALAQDPLGQSPRGRPASSRNSPWERLPPGVRRDLARVLDAQLEEGLAAHNHSGLLEDWRSAGEPGTWPRYFFEDGMTAAGRRGLLVLHAKLSDEGLWDLVGALGWIDREGDTGFMFTPGTPRIRTRLRAAGYGSYWMADNGSSWGVRSPRTGAQLHFRKAESEAFDLYTVHVDLNNPGSSASGGLSAAADAGVALRHWWEDDRNRGETHTPDTIRTEVVAQGIPVPEVDDAPYDGLRLTDFLKWETDPDDWFGHLWLQPAALRAGWWTEDEGARDFSSVRRLSPREGLLRDYPRFELTYSNGWVQLTIFGSGDLHAVWYQEHTGKSRTFEGELESGTVQRGW